MRRAGRTSETPCSSPKREAQARTVRGISTQVSSSLMLGRNRCTLRPHVEVVLRIEAQLRERNPDLGRPPVAVDRGARHPHQVEAGVEGLLTVGAVIAIQPHAGRGHAQHHRGSAIQEGVERNQDVLGLIGVVATAQRRLNLPGVARPHPRADVEGVAVVGKAHLHRVGRGRALLGLLLDEVGDRRGVEPDGFVEPPVHADGAPLDASGSGLLPFRCRGRVLPGDTRLPAAPARPARTRRRETRPRARAQTMASRRLMRVRLENYFFGSSNT